MSSRFQRERLPDAHGYYLNELGRLYGHKAWRSALCPLHDDSQPSLSVNIETGGFKCHGCGAHGGDVLAFHQRRYGLGFRDAAQALGAWEAA